MRQENLPAAVKKRDSEQNRTCLALSDFLLLVQYLASLMRVRAWNNRYKGDQCQRLCGDSLGRTAQSLRSNTHICLIVLGPTPLMFCQTTHPDRYECLVSVA